jgi:TetR/AcrR family transcriptional repressor of nem operon
MRGNQWVTAIDTRQRIMDMARLTVQARGYGGLSFRDLAKDVGIKSASIHYYFPSKGELGGALAERYTADFAAYLQTVLAQSSDPAVRIRKYTDVFRNTLLNENRMCLGGIMSAEHAELPPQVQVEVVKFSQMNVCWLAEALAPGARDPADRAQIGNRALAIFATIQGAQLIARGRNDIAIYDSVVETCRSMGLLP